MTRGGLLGSILGALATSSALVASCHPPDAVRTAVKGAQNVCAVDDDCAPTGTCSDKVCLALPPAELADVVLEITPGNLTGLGGVPVYAPLDIVFQRTILAGSAEGASLVLPTLTATEFTVTVPAEVVKAHTVCSFKLGSQNGVQAEVSMIPELARRGLPAPTITGTSGADGTVTLSAQRGTYDVYVRPTAAALADGECAVPPFLLRGYALTDATLFPIELSQQPDRLRGVIQAQVGVSFEHWRVDVVDASSGLRISTVGSVGAASAGQSGFGILDANGAVKRPIELFPPAVLPSPDGKPSTATPSYYLRLTPPEGVVAPTFAWDATLFTPAADGSITLDLSMYTPSVVQLDARLEPTGVAKGIAGTMWLRTRQKPLLGSIVGSHPGVPASFGLVVDATSATDPGSVRVPIVPGIYDVVGAPATDTTLGLGRVRWDVAPSTTPVAGLVLPMPERGQTAVSVVAPRGVPGASVPVAVTPVVPAPNDFDPVFGNEAVLPRGGSALTDDQGTAIVALDSGAFDLTVRFDARSGYPWAVMPNVTAPVDVVSLDVPLPFEVRGRISVPDSVDPSLPQTFLSGGTVRAFSLVAAQGGSPARYVQIGEAAIGLGCAQDRSQAQCGQFQLFLPSRLLSAP